MDAFNRELLNLAYETVKGRRGSELTVRSVRRQMERHWINYRDGTIAVWAEQIYAQKPHDELAKQADEIIDQIWERERLLWEYPDEDDDDTLAEFSAWGLAVLRWIEHEGEPMAPLITVTDDEIGVWLAKQEANQPLPQKHSRQSKGNAPRQLCLWGGA